MDNELKEYWRHLLLAEQKAQEDFDKTVIALSGGGLVISFSFLDKVIDIHGASRIRLLYYSWFFWSLSLILVLSSYYFSHLALRKAMRELIKDEIDAKPLGGKFDSVTKFCNASGALSFIVGFVLMAVFVWTNVGGTK